MENSNNYDTKIHNIDNVAITEFVEKNIFIINDLFESELCDYIVNLMDNSQHTYLNYTENNNVQCYSISIDNKQVENIIIQKFGKIVEILNKLLKIKLIGISNFELRKIYGETREHIDNIYGGLYRHPWNNTLINNIRAITIVISLNSDFTGGIYEFPKQNFSIKTNKGSCILFPPYWTHPHKVSKVEKDKYRYILSSWGLIDNIVIDTDSENLNNILIIK